MQHAFFVQWTHLKQYNDRYSVVAYLLTIGKINCLKHIRSQKFQGDYQKKIVEVLLFTNMAEEKADKALQVTEVLGRTAGKTETSIAKACAEHKTIPETANELHVTGSTTVHD